MARDANTPLILWICAAVCTHYVFAEGGDVVARIHEDRSFMALMGRNVRERVRESEATFDVALADPSSPDEKAPEPPVVEPPKPPEKKPELAKRPEPEKAKKEEPKKPEPKVAIVLKKEESKPQDIVPQLNDKRIAVRQHVKPNQADNPNARFVGDEANKVDDETVATQTSHDQDDPNPTPTGNHSGPQNQVGDSDRTKIAESEDHEGDKTRAPGEKGTEFDIQKDPTPLKNPQQVAVLAPKAQEPPRSGGDNRAPSQTSTPPPVPQLAPGGASPPAPEVQNSGSGAWSFNPVRPGAGTGAAPEPGAGQSPNKPDARAGTTQWLGLGGTPGPGQVNLNLTATGVAAVVGSDQLRKEREADGERRRSEHRGAWTASNFERWRSAIENYVSSVKPGNQTALNTAAVPFASYLNGMHNRIHPIFADNFLGSLDGLPKNHPLNDPKMFTRLEIVVTKDGHVVKMGIVKTSGITQFDIAALDSVNRAQPFGPAPGAIVSPDGNVYLHWEFHRDEVFACSTMNARPYLLSSPPKQNEPTPPIPGTPKSPSQERGVPPPVNVNEIREGALPRSLHDREG
jgi:TonB family protein